MVSEESVKNVLGIALEIVENTITQGIGLPLRS